MYVKVCRHLLSLYSCMCRCAVTNYVFICSSLSNRPVCHLGLAAMARLLYIMVTLSFGIMVCGAFHCHWSFGCIRSIILALRNIICKCDWGLIILHMGTELTRYATGGEYLKPRNLIIYTQAYNRPLHSHTLT